MQIYIEPNGNARTVYNETLDLRGLGAVEIRRASHVEPTSCGYWTADLSPLGGPNLGPFSTRSEALSAEVAWLGEWFIKLHGVTEE